MSGITVSKKNPLPVNYVAAKNALAACTRIDECKSWADKALALKSYAKQMEDRALEAMAQKIRDRAVKRGGQLLGQQKAAKGHRRLRGDRVPSSRKAMAQAAGLSADQAKQMLRVAQVPDPQFEDMVERDKPATVKELASAGTKKAERVVPAPYRNEWIDWTMAVRHLATLPACGLGVLAERRPDENADLRRECREARANLKLWITKLEEQ